MTKASDAATGGLGMELREALSQIAEIRSQLARTEVFRGYRSAPVAFSGVLAMGCAMAQAAWLSAPAERPGAYVTLWIGAALASALAAGAGMVDRRRRSASAWDREATRQALDLFLPSVVAGGLVTAVLATTAPDACWMLPGLWQVIFGLGVFASCRLLPRATCFVAAFYLASGVACLGLARGAWAFSPLAMGLPFGFGQLFAAAILYLNLERGHGAER